MIQRIMNRFPSDEREEKLPPVLHSGRSCGKCGCKTFTVKSGGSVCCAWVDFTCTQCGESEEWDISDGSEQ